MLKTWDDQNPGQNTQVSEPQVLHRGQLASSKDGQKFIVFWKLHSKTAIDRYEYY